MSDKIRPDKVLFPANFFVQNVMIPVQLLFLIIFVIAATSTGFARSWKKRKTIKNEKIKSGPGKVIANENLQKNGTTASTPALYG